jgi:hypothetical protein
MMEKVYYEIYVEADNAEKAEEKAIEDFGIGGGKITENYIDYIETEELQ